MQELHDIPLFFSLHNISGTVKCTSPSAVMFRSAVINAGYQISSSHCNPLGLKSDAPWDVIWDIMRCWVNIGCLWILITTSIQYVASSTPWTFIYLIAFWNIWTQVKNHPIKEQPRDSPGTAILSKSPQLEVCYLFRLQCPLYACMWTKLYIYSSFCVFIIGKFL